MKRFSSLASAQKFVFFGVSLLTISLVKPSHGDDLQKKVETAFSKIRVLKPLNPGQKYTLTVRGKPLTGTNDDFLRRRDSAEILKSGLSCGCGDYAIAFERLAAAQRLQTRFVDGAEISTASLADHFSGHVVVAVRDSQTSDWWLVNPTDQTILSKHWVPQSCSFEAFDRLFWIGYNGPLAAYRAHNPSDLQRFYAATLHQVPVAWLNRHLQRLSFSIDASLRDEKGALRNPRLLKFVAFQAGVFQAYHLSPLQAVNIELVLSQNDDVSHIEHLSSGGWRGFIGLKSACSPSLLDNFEININHPS